MNFLGPTKHRRLNEALAFVYLGIGFFLMLSLASYNWQDPSWNTVSGASRPVNLTGFVGAYLSDFFLQLLGIPAWLLPVSVCAIGWKWIRSAPIDAPFIRLGGSVLALISLSAAFGLLPVDRPIAGAIPAGGMLGMVLAAYLVSTLNLAGACLATLLSLILSLYLVSKFEVSLFYSLFRGPLAAWNKWKLHYAEWKAERARAAEARAQQKAEREAQRQAEREAVRQAEAAARPTPVDPSQEPPISLPDEKPKRGRSKVPDLPMEPMPVPEVEPAPEPDLDDIPIRTLEHLPPAPKLFVEPTPPTPASAGPMDRRPPWEAPRTKPVTSAPKTVFQLPPTSLLHEAQGRTAYDSQELKDIAARIKAKFEEFHVLGSVTQINPGPVVTTFEFKPEAGVKYSRITTLSEDLCLGLQAESILIERIPGKPTVGIEVPNSKREVINLRQILESEEFQKSPSPLTFPLGKDISGRIKLATMESMPHLLIAGSTGSGKSVMLNSMIMSVLYKSTPDEVRLIMVDPKRLELGLYEGIPHLLTPVITDPKKATNALRNAVIEMERRLKLLASQGVRNIDQFNRKVRKLMDQPRSLFEEPDETAEEELRPLPYILIIIDELADLMMLERANVEESVARLAQMARAVGMHLVLATQRPSVDVITGLIKANFPSRISFRVATRVDSRTVLDVMGAEHLLGKGDMLFLPPGSSRLVRVHGAFVTEGETNDVVDYWKQQATPEYDKSFLLAPPSDDEEGGENAEFDGEQDPMYQDAVRVVLEMGKASTSILQRRLRLGYGRAARILDMMQHEGIIGPPDGSRPREVLKTPDWLSEIENHV